ncbi:MAG: hypothetical protein R3320_11040 [Nitriliruptorales bacterium]|nr:hypothetical protein [Nitriliruptorales bacterium]
MSDDRPSPDPSDQEQAEPSQPSEPLPSHTRPEWVTHIERGRKSEEPTRSD